MNYLLKRAGWYYFNRKVPVILRDFDNRRLVRIALNTECRRTAVKLAVTHNGQLESYWQSLAKTGKKHVEADYTALVERARLFDFSYHYSPFLAELPTGHIIQRLQHVSTQDYNKNHVEAVLGAKPPPEIKLDDALNRFRGLSKDQTLNKSPNQIRKWENPRKKAMKNFIACIGNKLITELTRDDILKFRDWWIERIKAGEVVKATANKDFKHIKTIVETVADNFKIKIDREHIFWNLLLEEDDSQTRLPFETDYITSVLLNPQKLSGLEEQQKYAMYAFSETGAGFTELLGLRREDILLNEEIPHIWIRRRKFHNLKTTFRDRKIPIVGYALEAFRACPDGFTNYYDQADELSTEVNKYLRENGMMPSEQYSVYSLRHSFQDRLTDVDAGDRVQADLMGHKFKRETYGKGATLAKKLEWLLKIQLKKLNVE